MGGCRPQAPPFGGPHRIISRGIFITQEGKKEKECLRREETKSLKISWHIVCELHEPGAVCYPRATLGMCLCKLSKGHGMIECRARMARANLHLRPISWVHPSTVRASEIGRANGQFVLGVPFRLDSRCSLQVSRRAGREMSFAELLMFKCTFHARIQALAASA